MYTRSKMRKETRPILSGKLGTAVIWETKGEREKQNESGCRQREHSQEEQEVMETKATWGEGELDKKQETEW